MPTKKEIWVDCGYEDSPTMDRTHVFLKIEDVKDYCNEKNSEIVKLRKEIKELKKELIL